MSNSTATPQQLFDQWNGQIVPSSFNAGFVTLSYVVSLIGSASTLELINRRTAPKGKFNHLLLVSAAITMGGIAIWCMHYVGNRAIDLANGETELQIAYSSGFTALSFFVPILVLLAAFVAIGTNSKVSWWRVAVGGALAGAAICGMHYLGNASINNYVCMYNVVNVVGSAIIAVAASITALALFFVFRAAWTNSWWKRGLCAIVLAGAVSGMHWCAATGTRYRLVSLNTASNELSRNTTVIVVICLSVGACAIMGATAVYTARVLRRYAHKAQQVTLAAAVFDKHGRVLVSPDGLLPSEKITDSFLEKTPQDSFSEAHPLFHWMFQASRNWSNLASIIRGMSIHLSHLPRNMGGIKLINEHGELIDNYDVIFRELFCVAAESLAEKMKIALNDVGVLWDEILPTGAGGYVQKRQRDTEDIFDTRKSGHLDQLESVDGDLAEKGAAVRGRLQEIGRGSLMFLVRRVESSREVDQLEAAGFRFAELHQVSGIIGSSMQIKTRSVENKLKNMALYAEENNLLEPGVHLGLFAVRARVGGFGFDISVRNVAHNLLPSVQLPLERLEPWQAEFLRQFDRMTATALFRKLETMKSLQPRETLFASQMIDSIHALRSGIDDPIFDDAIFNAKVVDVPCRAAGDGSQMGTASMITFRLVIPIHLNIRSPLCTSIPLSFFKVHQLVYKDSPHNLAFSRSVHREISPVINAVPLEVPKQAHTRRGAFRDSRMPNTLRRLRPGTASTFAAVDADGNPVPTSLRRTSSPHGSNHSSSTLKLWHGRSSSELRSPETPSFDVSPPGYPETVHSSHGTQSAPAPSTFGGIMVSQEITVDVQDAEDPASSPTKGDGPRGNGRLSAKRASGVGANRGHGRGGSSGEHGATIEMRRIGGSGGPNTGRVLHIGTGMQFSNVEVENLSETATYVDELFATCVDGR